ncbi:hypothetical protein [Vibrio campbellii]|uniref:hypothetical protein n=1 Tax=Vibrio campbellii TaxID=680 RepID=UPI00210ABF38|nr:hypothetical protein [Vibrio campbellii]UTZ44532.1 hypothetical protein HB764_25055 [Vibrio campbellii]
MSVSQGVITKMNERGCELVEGAAVLNDFVVVEFKLPSPQTRVMRLTTPKSVEVFNKECTDGWSVFRQSH